MRPPAHMASPGVRLLGAALLALIIALVVVYQVLQPKWFGLTLMPDAAQNGVRLVQATGPSAHLPAPAWLVSVDTASGPLTLTATDRIEEADVLESYTELERFLRRQAVLFQQMQTGTLSVVLRDDAGVLTTHTLTAEPHRPAGSLPSAFWVQLLSGVGGFIIGAWVLVLRRGDPGARCFALTGTGLMLSAFAAAIYSTRELALPYGEYRVLMTINHTGSMIFGMALLGLFLLFPNRLVSPRWGWLLAALTLLWVFIGAAWLMPSPVDTMYTPILLQSCGILLLIAVQWWRSRGHPAHAATLRWLGLASVATVTLFVVTAALPALLNISPFISQGHAFGFFLIIYAGLALGLRRYRLFDLDRWAFHVLLWVIAGLALVLLDLTLIAALKWNQQLSLTLSLIVCGFLWLPLRGWLWRRLVEKPRPGQRELFNRIIEVALAPSEDEYRTRWQQLLHSLFNPARLHTTTARSAPALEEDGMAMVLPAVLHSPPLRLSLAAQGRRLFTPRDCVLAAEVIDMLHYANDNRNAYQQGAQQERRRIAQDLHDDLGSRLLTGLHQPRLNQVRDTIGLALAEMRVIIRGLSGQPMALDDVLAELRQESWDRLDAAGIELDWPLPDSACAPLLEYGQYRHLLSVLRELISNIIRHAGASHVRVAIRCTPERLYCEVEDNGAGFDGDSTGSGQGLGNLRRRVGELAGELQYQPLTPGTRTRLTLPLARGSA
ncbi:sensor histidine kinase [Alcanivorax sp. S71-1-4]|uniref:sensor histidine kinase n=1 Tax=Alcanivorax sp. S71-1-4 TaxID=1177159 RepID=UPI00135AB08F|nr:ATP-binding protein [Alcanivorax sp. S71-1-4]KAF0810521.1 sensor histidine kinase [Alcanivorax sp. S71-1-4]